MTATLPMTATTAKSVTETTVCISVSFGKLGNSRKISSTQIEVDADKGWVHASKDLLDSKELKAIYSHCSQAADDIKKICLPSLFRSGVYLVPVAGIDKVEGILNTAVEKLGPLVEAFLTVYAAQREEAQIRLKGLYNPTDYPSSSKVRKSFYIEWNYLTFAAPTKLQEVSADFYEKEKAKIEAKVAQADEQITLLLRAELKDLMDHMIERLKPDDEGKRKRFHGSNLTKIREFLDNFSMRNVTGDAEMTVLVDGCKKLLDGVDPESLKKNDGLRDGMTTALTMVKQNLDAMVVEAGSRMIDLEDEE